MLQASSKVFQKKESMGFKKKVGVLVAWGFLEL